MLSLLGYTIGTIIGAVIGVAIWYVFMKVAGYDI